MELSLYAHIAVGFVAVLHVAAGVVEMKFWPKFAKRVAGIALEHGEATTVVGWNQGLYNLFLAGGLIYSLIIQASPISLTLQVFCLICVALAGLGGWYSMGNWRVAAGQTGFAVIALALVSSSP